MSLASFLWCSGKYAIKNFGYMHSKRDYSPRLQELQRSEKYASNYLLKKEIAEKSLFFSRMLTTERGLNESIL